MLTYLFALAAVSPSPGANCAAPVAPPAGAARAADARRVARAWKDAGSIQIENALVVGTWRLVWAKSSEAEPGIFFFQRRGSHYAYRGVWGGVLESEADVADAVRWAEKLGAPRPVAQCFAARLFSDGP